ncbi:MAG TPA: hypothetical protein VMM12_00680 [Longimicrobiales bacterium]|nr:hypothetical protein [Longimicrobiales bacterium]
MADNELQSGNGPMIAALVADLMFASRVRGAAPGAKTVHHADALAEAVGRGTRLVLVDLHAGEALAAIRGVRAAGATATIVAFGSHVETEVLQSAREAGADRVMARSAFVRELPSLVARAVGQGSGEG